MTDKISFNPVLRTLPSKTSNDTAWIDWYKQCRFQLGRKNANSVFVKVWSKRGTSQANSNALREELKKGGVILSTTNVFSDIRDFAGGIGDFIEGTLNMGKTVFIITGVIVLGGAAMIVFNLAKDPIRAIGAASKLK